MSTTGQPQHGQAASSTRRAVALVFVAVLAASSCGGDDDPAAEPSTTTRPSTSTTQGTTSTEDAVTTTTSSPGTSTGPVDTTAAADPNHQAVIDAYAGYWEARLQANTGTPNPQDPALAQYATGNQLQAVVAETQSNLDEDRAFRAAQNPANYRRVTVVSVDGDRAEVQECFVDDTVVIQRSTSAVLNDTVSTQSVLGTLRLVGGSWRVSGSELVQRWEGVAGCALAS